MVTMFEVDGQRLEYRVLGEGSPILWINNIGLAPSDDAAYQSLTAAGHQVVVFDDQGPGSLRCCDRIASMARSSRLPVQWCGGLRRRPAIHRAQPIVSRNVEEGCSF
jgi:hypothetical protein